MCGLAGFLTLNNTLPADMLELRGKLMAEAIHHRGPDSHGIWIDPDDGITLAHRRLAILDLSPNGHQPMASPSGRYMIAFNGEVYNFASLRAELEKKNYIFRGGSDTEVMLAAFEEWGIKASLKKFNGMFAFALWDKKEKQLILARDRMGQKPLFAGWHGQTFFFASELKALQAHPDFKPEINRQSLPFYTQYGVIPAPFSIFDGIFKIKPGEFAIISPKKDKKWNEKSQKYYFIPDIHHEIDKNSSEWSENDAIDALKTHLKTAVSRRMIADVPLGAFLSGGIDSSLIVSIMRELSDKQVKTFTIGFHEKHFDEAPHAKAIAKHLGTDHTEMYVSEKDARDLVPSLTKMNDEPFADSSIIPTSLVAYMARKHVTVALSGDGGDELFMGYRRHFIPGALRSKLPSLLAPVAGALLNHTPADIFKTALRLVHKDIKLPDITDSRLKAMAGMLKNKNAALYYDDIVDWSYGQRQNLFQEPLPLSLMEAYAPYVPKDMLAEEQMALLDMLTYLPDDIHMKVDCATMTHALEARAPFMDPELVRFALSVPASMKIRHNQGKWLLRELLAHYIPREMFERPKAGFAVPLDKWLRHDLCDWSHEQMAHLIGNSDSLGMRGDQIRQFFERYQKTGRGNPHLIWALCMLGQWHEKTFPA